ncbi:hypothetical protein L596_023420 [Steinernema carpocapsae]|uniref:Mediator of RNA polymerase II transcription subunit 13 n=1 Tax=Steinernema carpocapsae TaxID=34508 RepID=A0A4U5MDL2_STECR|nr:hypothetical protein L596_023420 [Steinernema carpocapsae]
MTDRTSTELTGLKWRFYVTPADSQQNASTSAEDPSSSPVLQAYGRCLNKGHVCHWRKKGSDVELWVFWFADADFESIKELTSGLKESEESSTDISYETRLILFNALHTKMEVALRNNGYLKFGKWFTSPVDLPFLGHRELVAEHTTAFNFHFTVYGENTVAAIMSVQRQRPLSWLTKAHFAKQKQQVILGPFGIRGTLVGKVSENCDRHFEEWQHHLGPLPDVDGLPKMVQVEVEGRSFPFPSVFVCVVLDDNLLVKDFDTHFDEEAAIRRTMNGFKVSLMSLEEAVLNGASNESQSDMDLNINCSQPGSVCYCPTCRNNREVPDVKFDLTPEKPSMSCSPMDGILFQNEKSAPTHEPRDLAFEDLLKATAAEIEAESESWHMADNFDGIVIKGWDAVHADVLAGVEKSALFETKDPKRTNSPFLNLFGVDSPESEKAKKAESNCKENDSAKTYQSALDLIANTSDIFLKRTGDVFAELEQLQGKIPVQKTPKRKCIAFPVITTTDMDDLGYDDKSLATMRIGTDELSIDMSPASLDDPTEPAYRHELVNSAVTSSSAPPSCSDAQPPRLYPEVVQPSLLSPPVSNEQCEPDLTCKPIRGPQPYSPVLSTALKVKDDASRIHAEHVKSMLLTTNFQYSKMEIKRMKTAKQTLEFNNLSEKYLKHLSYSHRTTKADLPQIVDYRKLMSKMDGQKKVVPEKELRWFEKEFRPRPAVPTFPSRNSAQPTAVSNNNRPHQFHPYLNPNTPQRMGGPMGPPGAPHPMQMRPHMYNLMQQNGGQPGGPMMPPHWNPHQIRSSPAYMNSPNYMGQMGAANNSTTFSPSYGSFQNNRNANSYMATPPHRAALPSPSPGPTVAGTPATPGSIQPPNSVFSPPPSSVPSVPAVSSVKPVTDLKALAAVVQLKDTVLDVHYDASFEANVMCACQKNIFGRDYDYIIKTDFPNREITFWSGFHKEQNALTCMCAFSAVRHRFLSYNAGMFPDDAREATGVVPQESRTIPWFNPDNQKDHWLMNLVRQMSLTTDLNISNALALKEEVEDKQSRFMIPEIEKREFLAEMRKSFELNSNNPDLLHSWAIQLETKPSKESEWIGQRDDIQTVIDIIRESIRGKELTDDYGPLTWRQLHSKLSRRTDTSPRYLAEPIPYVVVGHEKEYVHRTPTKDSKDMPVIKTDKDKTREPTYAMNVAPTAIRHWDRLQLLPYNEPKNIMYIGIVPDSASIEKKAKMFFENLSIMYENCQLGRHIRFASDETPEGLLRVIKPSHRPNSENKFEDYTGAFENQLTRLLRENDSVFEKRAFHLVAAKKPPKNENEAPPSAASPFAGPSIQPSPGGHGDMPNLLDPNGRPQQMEPPKPKLLNIVEDPYNPEEETELLPHVVVVYVINPFTFGSHKRESQHCRDATLHILRAFNEVLYVLPPNRRIQLQLEIIDIHKVLNLNADLPDVDSSRSAYDYLREIAFNVYSQPRTLTSEHACGLILKSMTAFGLRSRLDISMTPVRSEFFSVPSNPFVLSRPPIINVGSKDDKIAIVSMEEKVMFISYCLLGTDWLLVSVTDGEGKMSDCCSINLTTRSQNPRYTQAKTQILDAMSRLWQYIMGILSADVKNWRVVINRVGRIGHGEFKAWAHLLSKPNIQRYCSTLKEKCKTCNGGGSKDCPVILSACLISMEPEAHLKVLPSATKKSPDAISCTHILVFGNDTTLLTEQHPEPEDDNNFEKMDFFDENDEEINDQFIQKINDDNLESQGRQLRTDYFSGEPSDILNQPLATGYYISTAPAADLPDWFWNSCPSARLRSPTHLRSSLLLTVANPQSEEMSLKQSTEATHPLECKTDAILRFILESYNSLSWLNINFSTGDRRSCLPTHIQALLRYYNSMSKLMT